MCIRDRSKTVINIKADKEVKEKAHKVAKEIGIPLSTVMNAFLKHFIRNKEVHFYLAPRMSEKLERTIARAERDLKKGKNISPVFSDPDEMLDYLHSK